MIIPAIPRPSVSPSTGGTDYLAIEQQLGDADVSAVGGHVQRRQVVDGHLVDGRLVVEEDARRVDVVALRRHVERRQTVLRSHHITTTTSTPIRDDLAFQMALDPH